MTNWRQVKVKIEIMELDGVRFPAIIHATGVKDILGVIKCGENPGVVLKYDPECEEINYIVVHKKNPGDDVEDGMKYIGNIDDEFFFSKELYERQQILFGKHSQPFQSPSIWQWPERTEFTCANTIVSGSIQA